MSTYPMSVESGIPGVSLIDNGPSAPGKRYKARVWDRFTKKRDTKSYASIEEAKAESRNLLAKFELRLAKAGVFTVEALKGEFLEYVKAKNISESQSDNYAHIIDQLLAAGVNNLKDDTIVVRTQAWLNSLQVVGHGFQPRNGKPCKSRKASVRTREKYIVALGRFGRWVRDYKGLHADPFALLVLPQKSKTIKAAFTVAECKLLVSDRALSHPDGLYYAYLLYTGHRQQEAAWIRSSHIKWAAKRIEVKLPDEVDHAEAKRTGHVKKVKRSYERSSRLPDELAEILAKVVPEGDGYIFPECFRTWASDGFARAIKRICKHVGFDAGDRTTHSTRHTNCAMMLAAGWDILPVKKHMGHTVMATTERYAERADSMEEETIGWNRRLCLRSPPTVHQECTGSAPAVTKQEQTQVDDTEDDLRPEDDLNDCEIIILPDHSTLFEQAGSGHDYAYSEVCKSVKPGSIPGGASNHKTRIDQTCDEDEEIGNPS